VNYFLFGPYNKLGLTKCLAGGTTNRYKFVCGPVMSHIMFNLIGEEIEITCLNVRSC
jgi:hypothetical protein